MNFEMCPKFETCSAPICPLDQDKKTYIWYPDEEICRRKDFANEQYIKTQKKLKKKANVNTYFTYKMLNRNFIVRKNIKGLNPDIIEGKNYDNLLRNERKYENKWLDDHPEYKMNDKHKNVISKNLNK